MKDKEETIYIADNKPIGKNILRNKGMEDCENGVINTGGKLNESKEEYYRKSGIEDCENGIINTGGKSIGKNILRNDGIEYCEDIENGIINAGGKSNKAKEEYCKGKEIKDCESIENGDINIKTKSNEDKEEYYRGSGKVMRLVEDLKDQIRPDNIVNVKYFDQNYLAQKETKLYNLKMKQNKNNNK